MGTPYLLQVQQGSIFFFIKILAPLQKDMESSGVQCNFLLTIIPTVKKKVNTTRIAGLSPPDLMCPKVLNRHTYIYWHFSTFLLDLNPVGEVLFPPVVTGAGSQV